MASSDKQNKGFIILNRQICENWVWQRKPFSQGQAWIDLLMMAGYEDKTINFDGRPLPLKRGEFVTSMRKLAVRWGWSTKKVGRFLDDLERDQMVSQKRNTKRTTIFIVNYSVYQGSGNTKRNSKETLRKRRGNTEENNETNINKGETREKENTEHFIPWDELEGEIIE